MKVFISWSGDLSRRVAELLYEWIPNVLQNAEVWISSEDIEKGEVWFGKLSDKLAEINVGVICLTRDNLGAPWILFEAGSLSKGLTKNRVCPLLIGLEPSDLKAPLSQFNATKAVKEDVLKLIKAISASKPEEKLADARVASAFEKWWPDFERRLAEIVKTHRVVSALTERTEGDMTKEILETVRAMHRLLQERVELSPQSLGEILDDLRPTPFQKERLRVLLTQPPDEDSGS